MTTTLKNLIGVWWLSVWGAKRVETCGYGCGKLLTENTYERHACAGKMNELQRELGAGRKAC